MTCGDIEQCSNSKVQKENYKTGADRTRTSLKIGDWIRYLGRVSILELPVTPAVYT